MAKDEYTQVALIRDRESGVCAEINAKEKANGFAAFSFAMFREFEHDGRGPVRKTQFLTEHHLPGALRVLALVERRIAEEKEKVFAERRRQREVG